MAWVRFSPIFSQEKDFSQSSLLLRGARTLEELLSGAPYPREEYEELHREKLISFTKYPLKICAAENSASGRNPGLKRSRSETIFENFYENEIKNKK
jgi:hypothetical protein